MTAFDEDDGGIVTITLTSCTVFWIELGFTHLGDETERKRAERLFDEEIGPWLDANVKGHCNAYGKGVWFADQADAALFRLMFHEKYI